MISSVKALFFFFSSRRRHTRCSRDWSSDVCSSDLGNDQGRMGGGGARDVAPVGVGTLVAAAIDHQALAAMAQLEGQSAGVSVVVEARPGGDAGVGEDERAAGLRALEPGIGR